MKKSIIILSLFNMSLFANYYNNGLYAYLSHNYIKAKKDFKLACIKEKSAWGCFSYANLSNNSNIKNKYLKKACKLGLKAACK